MINSKVKAQSAFKKLSAATLIIVALAMFFTACKQTSGGGGGKQGAPFVEGGASLILSPDKLTIYVKAKTADGSAITVEGCNETTLKSDVVGTKLHAKGTSVILKGKITELNCGDNNLTALNVQGLTALQELYCGGNQITELNVQGCASLQKLECFYNEQLTELNVQGCTALQVLNCWSNQLTALNVQGLTKLQVLYCYANQLNAQAMKEILNALPAREASDDAKAALYIEKTGKVEGNCKDFTSPELKAALEVAKSRNWKLRKIGASGSWEYL